MLDGTKGGECLTGTEVTTRFTYTMAKIEGLGAGWEAHRRSWKVMEGKIMEGHGNVC